jgi:hypothetical protein
MDSKLEVTLFWYDIPKVRGRDIFPNPSNILRRIGVRTNGSDWAIPTHLLPYNLINEMIQAGCNCHMMEFATDTAKRLANLLSIVSDSLDKQVKDSVNSVQAIADDAANQDESVDSPDKAASAYRTRVNGAIRRATVYLGDYMQAAKNFGVNLRLDTAISQVKILQTVAAARARVYAEATKEMAMISKLDGMYRAAQTDRVPPAQMADYLADHGKDEMSQKVMDAFNLNPELESAA